MRHLLATLCVCAIVAVSGPTIHSAMSEDCCECSHLDVHCDGENTAVVSWQIALNSNCSEFALTLQRKCGTSGSWTNVATNPTSPYTTSARGGAIATRYRLVMSCTCGTTTAAKMGPV